MESRKWNNENMEENRMPIAIVEAIESRNTEHDDLVCLQKQRLEELRNISSSTAKDRARYKREIVASLQDAGILDRSKKLAKEYKR